jgi:hypothetical protein
MRLSPFDRLSKDSWLHEAPLYGRPGLPDPRGSYTFEVFPVRPGEDVRDWSRIPRDDDDYEPTAIGFDIPNANSGTDYVLRIPTSDRPRLQWYSRSQFKRRFFYDPLDPPRPRDVDAEEWADHAEDRVQDGTESTMRLTSDRRTLLKRIARLWNGDEVGDVHLLADQCPTISHLTTGLDENTLKRFYYNTDLGREILLAFDDADWFEGTTGFLKSTTVFRKRAWYDLTQKGRTLINGRDEFPDLRGDPNEGLVHRITVGLVCLYDRIRGWNTDSYRDWSEYTIDAVANDQKGQPYAWEILTEHNNWTLYRKTYTKMKKLDNAGFTPIAVFDNRDTAYDVFNHWHRKGFAELPNGTFDSEYSVKKGRELIKKAYQSDRHEWAIPDWTTTWKLKQRTLGPNGPELSRDQLLSVNW